MSIEGGTKRTRAKAATVQPLGLSLDEGAAQIMAAFSAPAAEENAQTSAQPGEAATPAAAAPGSEAELPPAKATEPPPPAPQPHDTAPKIRPGIYRLDEEGTAEPISEEEALRYERLNADYTQKQQQLAEERRQFYAEQAALKAEREQIATEKAKVAQALRAAVPPEPNWDEVYARDPQNAATYYFAHQVQKQKAEQAEREAQAAQAKALADRQAVERAKLLELVPEWKDPEVQQRESVELSNYIARKGYDPQTVQAIITNSAALDTVRKAMMYEKSQNGSLTKAEAAKIKIDRVKVAPPGAASIPKAPPSQFDRDNARFRQTGKLKDAVAVFDHLLGGK